MVSLRVTVWLSIVPAFLMLAILFWQPVSAATCTQLPTDKGTASATFSVATAGTYRLWAHTHASASGASAFGLAIDTGCAVSVGGSTLPANAFSWVDGSSGIATPITINLTSGKHTMTVAGQDAAVGVDQALLLTSTSCVPVGTGNNCEIAAVATPSKPAARAAATTQKSQKYKVSVVSLILYVVAATIAATLVAVGFLYYAAMPNNVFRRLPFMKDWRWLQPQPVAKSAPVVVGGGTVGQDLHFLLSRKRAVLFMFGFAIVGGFATFIALAKPNYSIVVNLANATTAGQASIVANADAVDGHMVQFGNGSVPSKSAGTTPAAPSATHTSGSTSGTTSGSSGGSSSSSSSSGSSGSGSSGGSGSGSTTLLSDVSCNYQDDTWSGDAAGVGYSASKLSNSDGNPASFSVRLNANSGNTEVVGYPSDQCLMYSALPANLTSAFQVTPPAASGGLDYEYAYDIWLTTKSAAESYNWDNDLELMIWNYVNGQVPAGSIKATLSDGSKVWVAGDNVTGTVSVVLPANKTSGSVNIANIVSQLKSLSYVTNADNGILDVEYGVEAPYGGNQTFTVNSLSLSN